MRIARLSQRLGAAVLAVTMVAVPLPVALAQDASPVSSPAASPVASLDPALVAGVSIPMENNQRTGVVEGPGIAGSPQIDWQTPIDEESGWLPAVGDGIVVVVSRTRLNVFDRASGERLWSVPFDPDSGNPVLVDGTIYITGLGGAFAFDAATGEQRWQFDPGLEPATEDWMSPSTTLAGDPLVIGDTVYVSGGFWGGVYALDAATGEETWRIETVGSSPGTLSSTDEGLVFSTDGLRSLSGSSGESALRAVDLATGASLWETSLGPDVFSPAPIVIVDGVALVNVFDMAAGQTQVRAYDLATQALKWSTEFAPAMWVGAMSAGDGNVYVSGADSTGVMAFDLETGDLAWEHETAGSANGFAAVVDGALYVLTNDGVLEALETSTGGVFWSLSLGEQLPYGVSGPRVADGMIYADYGAGLAAIAGDGGPAPVATGGSDYPPPPAVAADVDSFFTFEGHLQTPEPFAGPQGVGVAADGTIYVIDAINDRIQIFDASGAFREIWGGPGDGDGQFSFHEEQGRYGGDIAFGADGTIYVAESNNGRIQTFAPDGTHLATWPIAAAEGTVPSFLTGIALDENADRIYVADWNSNKLLVVDMKGAVVDEWGADGAAGEWVLMQATDVAVADDGTVILLDTGRDRLRFFTPGGELITSWGGKGVDPGRFTGLVGVAVDSDGNIYTLDYSTNRIQVLSPSGEVLGVLSGIAGETEYFSNPWSVAIGPNGLVYVVDEGFDDGLVAVLRTPLTTAPVASPIASPAA